MTSLVLSSGSAAALLAAALAAVALRRRAAAPGPGPGPGALSRAMARRLVARRPIAIDLAGAIAVKRNEHAFVVGAAPGPLAGALHEVMRDPTARLGRIRLKRLAERVGAPFVEGERFHGCLPLDDLLAGLLERRGLGRAARVVRALLSTSAGAALARAIEDRAASDYAEITELRLDPPDGQPRVAYRYLDGSPIAGESTYDLGPLPGGRSLVRQVFRYQEVGAAALFAVQALGARFHDQVVLCQVAAAARLVGAAVLESTVPAEYADL